MNIINIEEITKVFGDKILFQKASAGIQQGEKIGIVGMNGSGKTTLLRMIAGEEPVDEGRIIKRTNLNIAVLPQTPRFPPGITIAAWSEGYQDQWKVQSCLTRLGITQLEEPVEQLSGGQKRKVALAGVLSEEAEVLILDEPTNHLDEAMVGWLEEYLNHYHGTVLMVTHDRYFLDRVCNRILEVSQGALYDYFTDYSGFLQKKAEREEREEASIRKRQSVLRMEMAWAARGCRARSTKQKARLQRLEELKNQRTPQESVQLKMDSIGTRMGKKTLEMHQVTKILGGKTILKDFSYIFLKNQTVGIVGPNGCGKSTWIKLLAGQAEADSGEIQKGETIRIGYFPQEIPEISGPMRVIDYVKEIGEYILTSEGRISASQLLERFLFSPDMQYSPVSKLSGGEKRRLYLMGVLAENPNVLLLDECSDSLDLPTLAVLEDYLNSFSGIVAAVSHDRYFLDTVADRILEMDGEGGVIPYEGGYTDYRREKDRKTSGESDVSPSKKATDQSKKRETRSWKGERLAKLKFTYAEQREFETIEEEIEKLETLLDALDKEMMEHASNAGKLQELTQKKQDAEEQLEIKMDRWVYLNDLAERIREQEKKN